MMILNYNFSTVSEYFQKFFSIIGPFTSMTKKEYELLGHMNTVRFVRDLNTYNYKRILDTTDRALVAKKMNIKTQNVGVLINSMKKKGIIIDNEINKKYIVPYETNGGIVFSLTYKQGGEDET